MRGMTNRDLRTECLFFLLIFTVTKICPCWLDVLYQPSLVIRVRKKDEPWFDDQCRHAFWPQAGSSSSVDS